jgi:hypothetical protein
MAKLTPREILKYHELFSELNSYGYYISEFSTDKVIIKDYFGKTSSAVIEDMSYIEGFVKAISIRKETESKIIDFIKKFGIVTTILTTNPYIKIEVITSDQANLEKWIKNNEYFTGLESSDKLRNRYVFRL